MLSLLPRAPALWIGAMARALAYRLAGKTRCLALAHLAACFPERPEAERAAIARGMFVHLGRAAMELVAFRRYEGRLERYVEFAQPGVLGEVMARGKGMIFVTGHVGNWELLAQAISRAGVRNAVIAEGTGRTRRAPARAGRDPVRPIRGRPGGRDDPPHGRVHGRPGGSDPLAPHRMGVDARAVEDSAVCQRPSKAGAEKR
jgi:hypothetical protein